MDWNPPAPRAFQAVLCFHLQKQNKRLNLHIEWKRAPVLCLRASTRHSGHREFTLERGVAPGRPFFPDGTRRDERVAVNRCRRTFSSLRAFEVSEWVDPCACACARLLQAQKNERESIRQKLALGSFFDDGPGIYTSCSKSGKPSLSSR